MMSPGTVVAAILFFVEVTPSSSSSTSKFLFPTPQLGFIATQHHVPHLKENVLPSSSTKNGIQRRIRALLLSSTTEEEEKEESTSMTSHDEETLFGSFAAPENNTNNDTPFPARHRKRSLTGNILPSDPLTLPPNPLDHSPRDPLINKLRSMRENRIESCPMIWSYMAEYVSDKRAIFDERLCGKGVVYDLTFGETWEKVRRSAAFFLEQGVEKKKEKKKKGDVVAVFAENSALWLIVDHGIQLLGGVSAVRGMDAPCDELRYIYEHCESAGIVVLQGPKLLKRLAADAKKSNLDSSLGLKNESGPVRTVVLIHRESASDEELQSMEQELKIRLVVFPDALESTPPLDPKNLPTLSKGDLSTIVYTSGTTGQPKGVMLTHGNLLHQIGHRLSPTKLYDDSEPIPGECMVSLLPVWHITERTFELWMLTRGCSVVYSSVRTFRNDLAKHRPQWMVLVPRVLEKIEKGVKDKFRSGGTVTKLLVGIFTGVGNAQARHSRMAAGLVLGDAPPSLPRRLFSRVASWALTPLHFVGQKLIWSKVRDGFGGRIKVIIAGGSALSNSLELFYETAGLDIVVGYGLTECSPLISHRRCDANLIAGGCVGLPTLDTQLRVVDPDLYDNAGHDNAPQNLQRMSLPDGQVGMVIAKGPQIMKGYYRNPTATAKVLDKDGWFDTGDLGKVNPATGDLILTGRCKDTIVLSNGENIEPSPLEDAILSSGSDWVEQIMLTAGKDGRRLVAIVVLNPNKVSDMDMVDAASGEDIVQWSEKLNDPKCSQEDCVKGCEVLEVASKALRSNKELNQMLMEDLKRATAAFRSWEQVGEVYMTLVPFTMANGMLTQSFKVKRDAVIKRFANDL